MTGLRKVPTWVVFHVPHASIVVPDAVRNQFVLSDTELIEELVQMTDHSTDWLFADEINEEQVVRSPVSRLVVDVERFPSDDQEPMSGRGMGVIYTRRANGKALRRELTIAERKALINNWYWLHHRRLESAVKKALCAHDQVLLLDCHSFPSRALPYELNQDGARPEICIGTDDFHTDEFTAASFVESFMVAGFWVEQNTPFSGTLVPATRYQKDERVRGVMIEVRRDLYLDEHSGRLNDSAHSVRARVSAAITQAIEMMLQENEGR